MTTQRVVFVGGGAVTIHAYAALVRRRRADVRRGRLELVVISADDQHSFHGFTGEVLAGDLPLEVTRTSLREALPLAAVVPGTVTHVDRARRVITYTRVRPPRAGATETMRYDELVVAPGGREPVDEVTGLAAHGFTLRGQEDVPRLLLRLAALEDPDAPAMPRDLVVIGGGFAGVEVAAALASRPTSVRDRRVHLVHAGPELLPDRPGTRSRVSRRADRELERLGVSVSCGVRAVAVGRRHVTLSDGRILPAALVLGTIGQRPVQLPGLDSLPTDAAGRLLTTPDLGIAPGIWAAGDAAHVNHPRAGTAVPTTALWATKAGDHLGRNLARTVVGRPTRPFGYLGLGQAASFGRGRGVADIGGVPTTGWVAWVVRLAILVRCMPSRGQAVETVAVLLTRRPLLPPVVEAGPDPADPPTRYAAVSTSRAAGVRAEAA